MNVDYTITFGVREIELPLWVEFEIIPDDEPRYTEMEVIEIEIDEPELKKYYKEEHERNVVKRYFSIFYDEILKELNNSNNIDHDNIKTDFLNEMEEIKYGL